MTDAKRKNEEEDDEEDDDDYDEDEDDDDDDDQEGDSFAVPKEETAPKPAEKAPEIQISEQPTQIAVTGSTEPSAEYIEKIKKRTDETAKVDITKDKVLVRSAKTKEEALKALTARNERPTSRIMVAVEYDVDQVNPEDLRKALEEERQKQRGANEDAAQGPAGESDYKESDLFKKLQQALVITDEEKKQREEEKKKKEEEAERERKHMEEMRKKHDQDNNAVPALNLEDNSSGKKKKKKDKELSPRKKKGLLSMISPRK